MTELERPGHRAAPPSVPRGSPMGGMGVGGAAVAGDACRPRHRGKPCTEPADQGGGERKPVTLSGLSPSLAVLSALDTLPFPHLLQGIIWE